MQNQLIIKYDWYDPNIRVQKQILEKQALILLLLILNIQPWNRVCIPL